MLQAARAVLKQWEGKQSDELGPLLSVAVEDVRTLSLALVGLLDSSSSQEQSIRAVSNICEATIGLKMIVKKAASEQRLVLVVAISGGTISTLSTLPDQAEMWHGSWEVSASLSKESHR